MIIIGDATDPMKHLRFHYREAEFTVFETRPELRTIGSNKEEYTEVDFGFKIFVDTSRTKNSSCGRHFIQLALMCEAIS